MSAIDYQLPGVTATRKAEIAALGATLGLTDFDPTSVNWDSPVPWSDEAGRLMPEYAGYLYCILFGVAFTIITMVLTFLESKFAGVEITSEHFNTAGRNVKTGLTAAVIVSQWTWAATLLQSSNVAWNFGVSGPYWYAAGASVQILLFGILAIEIKRKAPNAHTFLEMVDVRWGKNAHICFIVFGLLTNTIVSSMLMLGGTSTMTAASGMDLDASATLIVLGVVFYTMFGGLKATFLASYIHTSIIFVILVIMTYIVYIDRPDGACTNPAEQCNTLGSAGLMYERLKFIVALPANNGTGFHHGPVADNRGGSYLTMLSKPGLQFGIINTIGNFGTVFVDQSYWQSAIAASPASSTRGYLIGGLVWFAIPFTLATSLGLAGTALNVGLTSGDAGSGLVPPAAATVLMGPVGGHLVIIMLLMAITSTGSAECIAVSSLGAYDIYRKYINPGATGAEILKVSRGLVVVWGLCMILFNFILFHMGLNLGWVYNFMGTLIGSAVPPMACLILDGDGLFVPGKNLPGWGAMTAAVVGMVGAIIAWLVAAANCLPGENVPEICDGSINTATTGLLVPQLWGSGTALALSYLICVVASMVDPMKYDYAELNKGIKLVEDAKVLGDNEEETKEEFLAAGKAWIVKYGVYWTIFLLFGWPVATFPWGVFSKAIYQLWTSVACMWGLVAAIVIIFMPLYENRDTVARVLTCNPAVPSEDGTYKSSSTAAPAAAEVQMSSA